MSESPRHPPYQKLTGRRAAWGGVNRLWLGDDHLLVVATVLGVERYRRFYLRDIEALLVRRTSRRLVWNSVFGGIGGVCAALAAVFFALYARDASEVGFAVAAGFFAAPAAFCLAGLLITTLRGPTCDIFVQTAAGTEPLHVPGHLRPAQRLIARLEPLIEQAQAAGRAPA
jgi:hypothetical protein